MKARYELVDPSANHNKFWEIEYPADGDRTAFRTSWGRIGNAPATKVKEWPNAAKAEAEAQKITATKEREGYKLVNAREGKRSGKHYEEAEDLEGTDDGFVVTRKGARKAPAKKAKAAPSDASALLKSGVPFDVSAQLLKRVNNYLAKLEPEGKSQKREFQAFCDAVRAGTFTDGKRTVIVVPKKQAAVLAAVIDVARKMS